MPEVENSDIEEMTDDEIEQAEKAAIDGSGNTEVTGFAPRHS